MIQSIKSTLKSNLTIWEFICKIHTKFFQITELKVINYGIKRNLSKDVIGGGNSITIGKNSILDNVEVHIRGNNNHIIIGQNCIMRKNSTFYIEGTNCRVSIGNETTFNHSCLINVQEDNMSINIGENCMISNRVHFRTSDSHPIYNIDDAKRINNPMPITIGNNVWISADAHIYKGVVVNDGAIIGARSIVTKEVPSHCLVVGSPAKVVKQNVCWNRTF